MSEPTLATGEATQSTADLVSAALNDPATAESVSTNNDTAASSTGGHPAWQEILGAVPEVFHDKVRPTLEKWDTGVKTKLDEYTRTYEPYKAFVDAGASAEELQAGYQLMQLLNTDPEKFYKSMAEHYGYSMPSGQGDASSADTVDLAEFGEDITKHPKFQELAQQQQAMLDAFNAQQAQQEAAKAEAWLSDKQKQIDAKLNPEGKGIAPDWDYILNKAMTISQKNGGNYDAAIDTAAAEFQSFVEKTRGPVATLGAPPVIAPTGSVPVSGNPTAKTLSKDPSARKTLLANALNQALNDR